MLGLLLNYDPALEKPTTLTEEEFRLAVSDINPGQQQRFCCQSLGHNCNAKHHIRASYFAEVLRSFPKLVPLYDNSIAMIVVNIGFIPVRNVEGIDYTICVGTDRQIALKHPNWEIIYYKTLDDLIADYNIDSLRLIKLECEVSFLSEQVRILVDHIAYSPGGVGYEATKEEFTELASKKG